ncbi:ABC transporter permease [Muricomes intestini]|uniref:ABC-type lipoprotein release transport system permease subunit n=1 Tax=Muricomes intestini TaxID=1796634 RepID=A0A4R3K269_9FIRM|nr:ABC transporter permease [Muricomes intestini]TCS76206.1 ABC-type lipoprotein release transport system permease subunit [Muricomes intestini]HAX50600.1 ABC transporter permease [Lachnospiraceae bacterium]
MRWIDLLRMSSGSLKRRKLRTFLTVLGVVIGTASIVVMISLGLGMQQSMYREVEQSGGMTSITVTGKLEGGNMYYSSDGSSEQEEPDKYITDDAIKQFQQLEHVKSANPVLDVSAVALKGKYIGYLQLEGMTPEALKERNIELIPDGRLPNPDSTDLELLFGNGVLTSFYEKATDKGYWETGEVPDIDLQNDQMFLILDSDNYFQNQSADTGATEEGNSDSPQTPARPPKKYVVKGCGVVAGDIDTYTANYYYVYCDINKLEDTLKKEFRGRVIPGQPTTKSGKPYRQFVYTSATVQAENLEDVDELSAAIRNMGFQVTTNAEYMDSMKKQFAMIQALLGGIGAVSLFVAAIGIANTMMMSIYERTKEIGVIKVLGCSLKNIKQMFLLEAAFIGLIGGIVGNILSFGMSFIINLLTGGGSAVELDGNLSYIPPWLVLASMAFAVFVGMAAGYFPALRAMRLSPLAAIRNE